MRCTGVAPPSANSTPSSVTPAKIHVRRSRRAPTIPMAARATVTAPRYSVWSLNGFEPQ